MGFTIKKTHHLGSLSFFGTTEQANPRKSFGLTYGGSPTSPYLVQHPRQIVFFCEVKKNWASGGGKNYPGSRWHHFKNGGSFLDDDKPLLLKNGDS